MSRPRALVSSLLAIGLASPVAAAVAQPTVTQLTGNLTRPGGALAAAPDGRVWVAETANPGLVARIGAAGTVKEYSSGNTSGFPKDKKPQGMTVGPDGAMWLLNYGPAVARFSLVGDYSELDAPKNDVPTDIATGPDGNLWFTDQGSMGAIGRVTPGGQFTEFTVGLGANSVPNSITAGPDGAMWFTDTAGAIGRIGTDGAITEFTGLGNPPDEIAAGPDGALWFTEPAGAIGRITTGGVVQEFSQGITPGRAPGDIAPGPDGALWFTETGPTPAIGRIATDGTIAEFRDGLPDTFMPASIAPAPDGGMVFTGSAPAVQHVTVPPAAGATVADAGAPARATLAATVRPNGLVTTYHFEYRQVGAPAERTPEIGVADGVDAVPVAAVVDVAPDTTYRAHLVATSEAGAIEGPETEFHTPPGDAPPADQPPAAPGDAPPAGQPPAAPGDAPHSGRPQAAVPTLGRSVVLRPVKDKGKGKVKVKVPGARHFVSLEGLSTVPVGSVVDASHGRVRLRSALDVAGADQVGTFRGGAFKVVQRASGGGRTDLLLRGGDFSSCPRPSATPSAVAARLMGGAGGRRVRRLWGKDRGGRFRTHGRDSVATVRGTHWLTEDRCGGTLTRVTAGAVAVRAKRGGRAVLVRAGHARFVSHRG